MRSSTRYVRSRLAFIKLFEDRGMEQAVGCQGISTLVGAPSAEVGQASAGLLHDDQRCGEVPGVELRLEHRLTDALGDQRVAPEIAEAAVTPGRAGHGIEA